MADPNEERASLVADGTLGLAELTRNRENVTQAEPQLEARLARLEELQAELQGRVEQVEATQKELDKRARLDEIDKRLTGLEPRDEQSTPPGASSKEQTANNKPDSSEKVKRKKSGSALSTICIKGEKEEESNEPQQDIPKDEPTDKPTDKKPNNEDGEQKETRKLPVIEPKVSKTMLNEGDIQKPKIEEPQEKTTVLGAAPQPPQIEKSHSPSGFSSEEEVEEHQLKEEVPSRTTSPKGARRVAFGNISTGDTLPEGTPTTDSPGDGEPQQKPVADASSEMSTEKEAERVTEGSPTTTDTLVEGAPQIKTTGEDDPGDTQPSRDICGKEDCVLPTPQPPTSSDIPGEGELQTTATGEYKPEDTQSSRESCGKQDCVLPTLEPPTSSEIPGEGELQTTATGEYKPEDTQSSRESCGKEDCVLPTLEPPTSSEKPCMRELQTPSTEEYNPGDTLPLRDNCGKENCVLPPEGVPQQQPVADASCELPSEQDAEQVPQESPKTTDTPAVGEPQTTDTGEDKPGDSRPSHASDTCGKVDCVLPPEQVSLEPPTSDIPREGVPQQQPVAETSNELPSEQEAERASQESPTITDTPGEGAPQTIATGEYKAGDSRPSTVTCGKEDYGVLCSCGCGTVMPSSSEMPISPCGCPFQCADLEPAPEPKRVCRRGPQSAVDPKAQPQRPSADSQGKVPRKRFAPNTSKCEPNCVTKAPPYVPDQPQQFTRMPVQSAITPDVFNCGARRRTSAFGAPTPVDTKQTAAQCGTPMRRESALDPAAVQRQSCATTGARNQSSVSRRYYKDSRFSTTMPQRISQPPRPSRQTPPWTCSMFDSPQAGESADPTDCGPACCPPGGTQNNQDTSTSVSSDFARFPARQDSSPATSSEEHRSSLTSCSKCRSPSISLVSSAPPQAPTSASFAGPCRIPNATDRVVGKSNVDPGPQCSTLEPYNSRRSRTSTSANRRPSDRSFACTHPQYPTPAGFAGLAYRPPSRCSPPKTPSIGSDSQRSTSVASHSVRSRARTLPMSFSDNFVGPVASQPPQVPDPAVDTCSSACCPTSTGRSMSLSSFSTSQCTSSACSSPGCNSCPDRSEGKPVSSMNVPCGSPSTSGNSLKDNGVQFQADPPQTPATACDQCRNEPRQTCSVATSFSNPMMYPPQNQTSGIPVDPFQSSTQDSCMTSLPPPNAPVVREGSPYPDTMSIASCPAFTTPAPSSRSASRPSVPNHVRRTVNPSVSQSLPTRPSVSPSPYAPNSSPAPYGYSPQASFHPCASPAPSQPTIPLTCNNSPMHRGRPSQRPSTAPRQSQPPLGTQRENGQTQDSSEVRYKQPSAAPRRPEPADTSGAHLLPCPVMPVAGAQEYPGRRASQNSNSGSSSRKSRSSSETAYVGSTPCGPGLPTKSSDAYPTGMTGSNAGSGPVQFPASTQSQRTSAPRRYLSPSTAQPASGWTQGTPTVRGKQPSGVPRASNLAEAPAAHLFPCPTMPVAGAQGVPSRRTSQNSSSGSGSRRSRSSNVSAFVGSTPYRAGFPTESSDAYPTGSTGSNAGSCTVQSPASTQSQRSNASQSPCASTCGAGGVAAGPAAGSVNPGGVCPSLAVPENHAPDGTFSCSHQCPAVAGTAPCPSLSTRIPEEMGDESSISPIPDRFDPPITVRCTHRSHSVRPYLKCNQRHPRCPNKINPGLSPCKKSREMQDRCVPSRGRR